MILLDTDHISVLLFPESAGYATLTDHMPDADGEEFATSIITVEESMRGWMAVIGRERQVQQQVPAYERLRELFDFFAEWESIPFDDSSADEFDRLRAAKVRIPTPDLKIAAISLVNNATLLTANRKDFEKVPGLKFENWLIAPSS